MKIYNAIWRYFGIHGIVPVYINREMTSLNPRRRCSDIRTGSTCYVSENLNIGDTNRFPWDSTPFHAFLTGITLLWAWWKKWQMEVVKLKVSVKSPYDSLLLNFIMKWCSFRQSYYFAIHISPQRQRCPSEHKSCRLDVFRCFMAPATMRKRFPSKFRGR